MVEVMPVQPHPNNQWNEENQGNRKKLRIRLPHSLKDSVPPTVHQDFGSHEEKAHKPDAHEEHAVMKPIAPKPAVEV